MNNEEIQQKVEEYELDVKEIRMCDKLEIRKLDNNLYGIFQDGKMLQGVQRFQLTLDANNQIPVIKITSILL